MADDTHVNRGLMRSLCEALFSLHLAFAGIFVLLTVTTGVYAQLGRMERSINALLDIPDTHNIRGYFAIWIPSVCVAALSWIVLRALAHKPFAKRAIPSAMGIIILFGQAAFRLLLFQQDYLRIDGRFLAGLAATAICAALLISGKWKWPLWAAWPLLFAHYWFWYFYVPGSQFHSPAYNGPAGPILGLCAALAWSVYFKRLRGVQSEPSQNAGRFPALGVLMLSSLAVGPIALSAQGPAPTPPGEVLRAYRKMDSEGGRLTTDGWYRAARYCVKPAPPPRYMIVLVIENETIEEHPRIIGNRTRVGMRRDDLGQIDSEGRFTSLVAPILVDASGNYRKKPWGQEVHGPFYVGGEYELVLTDTHWEFTPDRKDLREVRGTPEWRIGAIWSYPSITVEAAIRYLTRLQDEPGSEAIKRNAKKSIADLRRLANRKKTKAMP